MKVSLNFEFDNNEAAEAFLRQVRERAEREQSYQADNEAREEMQEKRTRRGRKKAEPEATPAPQPAEGTVTKEDAQAALEKVFAAKGLATARDLLGRYGVQRLQDMSAEKYAEFIAEAQQVVDGKDPAAVS